MAQHSWEGENGKSFAKVGEEKPEEKNGCTFAKCSREFLCGLLSSRTMFETYQNFLLA